MSDFDDVLERLLTDPLFQANLRANPDAALAGYRLDPEERQLLASQVDLGAGADRTVEMRVSKSGVMGMVGPVVSAFGLTGPNPVESGQGAFGLAPSDEGMLDPGDPKETFGTVHATEVFGVAGASGSGGHPSAPIEAVGYHTRVDVDGDGTWDAVKAYERPDGGVDVVHTDAAGRVDFVGHDLNRDGLIDTADFDTDGDSKLDTRMYDDNGDGWMDRSAPIPGSAADVQTFGQAPQR
jgi:hypothetical protein